MLSFPDLLKEIRTSADITQKEFAEILDVSTVLVSMVESGQKEVSKAFILKMAKALDVHPSSITPFLFTEKEIIINSLSVTEKALVQVGERMQVYLIKNKAKRLKKHGASK